MTQQIQNPSRELYATKKKKKKAFGNLRTENVIIKMKNA